MLIYAAIGAFGFLFLLIMLFVGEIFGGDHDMGVDHDLIDHDGDMGGPSVFSTRIMASFLTAFGVGGAVARYYGLGHPPASGVGVVSGIAMAGVVYLFARILYSQQASSEVRMAGLVGHTAEVTVAIPPQGIGQVALTYKGERTEHIARSEDGGGVPRGTEVTITALRGDSVVVRGVPAQVSGGQR